MVPALRKLFSLRSGRTKSRTGNTRVRSSVFYVPHVRGLAEVSAFSVPRPADWEADLSRLLDMEAGNHTSGLGDRELFLLLAQVCQAPASLPEDSLLWSPWLCRPPQVRSVLVVGCRGAGLQTGFTVSLRLCTW